MYKPSEDVIQVPENVENFREQAPVTSRCFTIPAGRMKHVKSILTALHSEDDFRMFVLCRMLYLGFISFVFSVKLWKTFYRIYFASECFMDGSIVKPFISH